MDHEQEGINLVEDYEEQKKVSRPWQSIIDEVGTQVFDDDKLLDDIKFDGHEFSDKRYHTTPMHVSKPIRDCVCDESIVNKLYRLSLDRQPEYRDGDFKLNMDLEWAKLEAEFRRERMELLKKHKKLIANGEGNLGVQN